MTISSCDVTSPSSPGSALHWLRALADRVPSAVLLLDGSGRCTYGNRRWSDLTGLDEGASAGERWRAAVHPDDLAPLLTELAGAGPVHRDVRLRGPSGFDRFEVRAERVGERDPGWLVTADALTAGSALPDDPGNLFRVCVETVIDCFGVFRAIRDQDGASLISASII